MKSLLLVDDEKSFLKSLREGLLSYFDDIQIELAYNGLEAIKILKNKKIDVVVTDLKMPKMDGFELLSYINNHYKNIVIMVMTAYATPKIKLQIEKNGQIQLIEKPLKYIEFSEKVINLFKKSSQGFITGISLASFLQLIELEKKTYTLNIKYGNKNGRLYIKNGKIFDAETKHLKATQAVYEIITWTDPEIELTSYDNKRKNNINSSVNALLLEGFKRKDEESEKNDKDFASIIDEAIENDSNTEINEPKKTDNNYLIELNGYLKEFSVLDDVLNVYFFNNKAELITTLNANDGYNFSALYFKEMLENALEMNRTFGFGYCKLMHISTNEFNIFFIPLTKDNKKLPQYFLALLQKNETDIGLTKIKLENISQIIINNVLFKLT